MENIDVEALKSSFVQHADADVKAVDTVEQLVQSINEAIQAFNASGDRQEKLETLYKIYQLQQHADDDFSNEAIASNETFRNTFGLRSVIANLPPEQINRNTE